jgi:hypothetical protein
MIPSTLGTMDNVVSLRPPKASAAVLAALVKLGYLTQGQRYRDIRRSNGLSSGCAATCAVMASIREGDLSRGGEDAGQEEAACSTSAPVDAVDG